MHPTSSPTSTPTSGGRDITNAGGNRRPGATGPAEDYACRTNTWVQYTQPAAGPRLGPIVLGRGANGAQISLYPGSFRVSSDIYICDGVTGAELDGVAYRGESPVAYDGVGTMSIIVYAIDVRTVLDLDPFVQNFAPFISSIQINPQTVNVGEPAMIKVRVSQRVLLPPPPSIPRSVPPLPYAFARVPTQVGVAC